mmetsp:Transcript_2183/g.3456  ORF Transcript_2183/g.3456 Transcript_2183/m.3456 type:complete len:211 (-) Transcript_2183:120-752(-)|eukprot:jgi/Bigna1/129830/aug1.10_g4538
MIADHDMKIVSNRKYQSKSSTKSSSLSKKRSRCGGAESSSRSNAVKIHKLPKGSLLYRVHHVPVSQRVELRELENDDQSWILFSNSTKFIGSSPLGTKSRVVEYRTSSQMKLLAIESMPSTRCIRSSKDMDLDVKGDNFREKKIGGTPTKSRPEMLIQDRVEAESLDGWISGRRICLKDDSRIRLVDDDKKTGLSQQLLTDMFLRLSMKS